MSSKPIKIRAMFTGTSSMGYESGKTYNLFLDTKNQDLWWKKTEVIIWDAEPNTDAKLCEYGSVKAFLANWTMVVSDKNPLYNTVHALLNTKHSRVIFALEHELKKEKRLVEKPSSRFSTEKITEGITEENISSSRKLAEESVKQFEYTLELLKSNKFVVGSDELTDALRNFARANLAEIDSDKFANGVIDSLKKKLVTE